MTVNDNSFSLRPFKANLTRPQSFELKDLIFDAGDSGYSDPRPATFTATIIDWQGAVYRSHMNNQGQKWDIQIELRGERFAIYEAFVVPHPNFTKSDEGSIRVSFTAPANMFMRLRNGQLPPTFV